MIPVTVESSAASAFSAGSSARASAPLSQRRPSTPFAIARASIARSASTCAALAATTSLPQRWWPTPRDSQWIEQPSSGDAQRRLQRPRRIVEAGVDDLAVARAGAVADAVGRLDDDRLAAAERELAGAREADDTAADDDGIDALHRANVRPAA